MNKVLKSLRSISIISIAFFLLPMYIHGQTPVYLDEANPINERIEDALKRMTLNEKIAICHAQSKFSTPGCPRLGIPEIWMSDGPHGIRYEFQWDSWLHADWTNDSCTVYPALSCLAATFNPALSLQYGNAIGEEARYRKKDIILGPGVNIYRSPLNGRNSEYFGEDPFLTSKMVVPYIQGVQKNGVAACIKHFALNNQEKLREAINVEASDRALHEIYLPAFEAGVVEGKVWAVMGSYNKFRGQFCSHNNLLVNKILKGDWNFDGVFITDWGSAHNTDEAARNGLDIEMGSWTNGLTWGLSSAYNNYYLAQPFLNKIKNGELPETLLDEKVRRILLLNFRTNMNRNRPYGKKLTCEQKALALKVAEEGIVLLKNEKNFFPIEKGRYTKIAIIGENAIKRLTQGGGSSELKPQEEILSLQGMIEKYGKDHVTFSLGYASGEPNYSNELPSPYNADSLVAAAVETAKKADVVIFFGGLNKNFQQDCECDDRKNMDLPFGQNELIAKLLQVNKNLGVVIVSGNAVSMPWINKINGLIQSWYLGSQGGTATANIISGDAVPSGKLPFTIPKKLEDNGANSFGAVAYPGDGTNVIYKEDILVGYRWFDTKKIEPLFPFGYGLSYTTFEYGKAKSDKYVYEQDETAKITFRLTNKGKIDGSEIVQLYISQKNPKLLRPAKELKGFTKVFLKAGEIKDVELTVKITDLAYYDDQLRKWITDADEYELSLASSSRNIRSCVKIHVNR